MRDRNRNILVKNTPDVGSNYRFILNAKSDYEIDIKEISEDMAELLGWIIAEGHYHKHGGISIAQNLGDKYERIKNLLIRMKMPFTEHLIHTKWGVIYLRKRDVGLIKKVCPKKLLTSELVYLPIPKTKRLHESLVLGDGHIKKIGLGKYWQFTQKNKETMDNFEILCFRLGWKVSTIRKKDKYQVYHTTIMKKSELFASKPKVYDKEDYVWCPNVPNGTWVAKRNGKTFITGNSYIDKSDHYQIWFRDVESRVDDAKHGKIAAVTTPIDPGDLGVLLYNNPKYVSKKYPAIVNYQNNDYTTGTSIWEERFPISKLMDIRERQGYANFERNYMVNTEADVEGSIFKTKNLFELLDYTRTFTSKLSDENSIVIIGADFGLSDGPHADFDAYSVLEKCPNGKMVLLHLEKWRGMSMESKLQRLFELGKIYNPYVYLVDKSNVGNDVAIRLINGGYSAEAIPFGPSSRGLVLGTLKSAVENKLLIIPYSKECIEEQWLINELFEQMIGFKEDKTEKTRITTIISRSLHDDLAIALALSVKGAVEQDIGGDEKLLSA